MASAADAPGSDSPDSSISGDLRFQQIEREKVSDRVAQELLRLIGEGRLAPGERLPGERQLAEMMHVSRVSIRSALQQLKTQGLITAIQGGGTRIATVTEEIERGLSSLVRANDSNLRDLIEIRTNLEVWAARRAAERRRWSPMQYPTERCLQQGQQETTRTQLRRIARQVAGRVETSG